MNQSWEAAGKAIGIILGIAGATAAIAFLSERIIEWKNRGCETIHKPFGMYERYIKRPLDCFLATGALIVLSPVLLILTIVGAFAMKGNPFFLQNRPGKRHPKTGKEKVFKLMKFRTMTNQKDKNGDLLPDEKRLSWYGRLLRASSADELPELLNIIKGDMSIVGPRPLLVRYLERYNTEQHHRHDVRPGLTGYAQAHGRNSLTWEEKFKMDVWYTKHISLILDIKIIIDTIKAVLNREGISSETSATMEEFLGSQK